MVDVDGFVRVSRLDLDSKKKIIEAVLNNPGAGTAAVVSQTGLKYSAVRTAMRQLGLTPAKLAVDAQKTADSVYVETIRTLSGFGKSQREIGDTLGIPGHRVGRIMERHGIVKKKVERHGRPTDYNRGCRCELCKAANRDRAALGARDRLARPEDIPHGTESGYVNWYCRCDKCRPVGLEKLRERTTTPAETQTRLGEIWGDGEVSAIVEYKSTARDHALALGRSVHGVNGARAVRGIRKNGKSRVARRVGAKLH